MVWLMIGLRWGALLLGVLLVGLALRGLAGIGRLIAGVPGVALVVLMGGVVGFIALSIMLPIFQLSRNA